MTADEARLPASSWKRAIAFGLVAGLALAGCGDMSASNGGAGAANGSASMLDSPLGSYLAGRYARANRDTHAAVDFFQTALADDPDNRTLRHRTFLLLLADGKIEDALELARSLAELSETATVAELLLAAEQVRAGHYEEAAKLIGEPGDRGFGALMKPLFLAWAAAGQGDIEAVEHWLTELGNREAFVPFRDYHAALILDYMGAVDLANTAYEHFRNKNGITASSTLAHASFLRRQGRNEEAEKVYEDLLKRAPENPPVRRALAELQAGKPAEPFIEDISDGVAEALYGAGGAIARERGGDAARLYVQIALYLHPKFDSALLLLGELLDADKRWGEAIDVYKQVPKSSPYYWQARIRVANNLDEIERVDEAVSELDAIAADRGQDTVAIVALADLLRARKRYADAAKAYDRAIARIEEPQERHWVLYYSRGVSLERSKQWERAEADFLKALELRPDHPLVLNYLGYSWIEQGLHLDRAQKMIEKAVSQRPNDGYIVDSLGWVLYRLKNYDGAVKHLERAVELKPEDPVINDHLGDAYWRIGRRLEARFQWRHALGLEPEPEEVGKIEAKLEKGLAGLASADARE